MAVASRPRKWYCGKCGFLNEPSEPQCQNCSATKQEGAAAAFRRNEAATPGPKTPMGLVLVGLVLLVVGIVITVLTVATAFSSRSGGFYIVAFGPIIAGIVMIARGLAPRKRGPTTR